MKILTGVSLDSKIVYNYVFTFLSLFSNLPTITIYYFVNKNVWNKNTGGKIFIWILCQIFWNIWENFQKGKEPLIMTM